jgi:hypothetical protein
MTQIFVQGAAREAFDGEGVFAQDLTAGPGPSFSPGATLIRTTRGENNSYPDILDGAGYKINKVPGVILGAIEVYGYLQPDRGWHTFLNAAFGPRTSGQLQPWLYNLIPYAGGAARKATGVWWQRAVFSGQYDVSGEQSAIKYQLVGMVLDPDNVLTAGTLAVPAYVGVAGAGISSFDTFSATNGQATPVTYDELRAMSLMLTNALKIQPSGKPGQVRMGAGCSPGQIGGGGSLTQLAAATVPTPRASGNYPLQYNLPTGDNTHRLVLDGSFSYDSTGTPYAPTEFNQDAVNYSLFATSAGATSGVWPIVASYV